MISVVIACRDDGEELRKTVRSLLDTAPEELDIVIVDDGSRMPIVAFDGIRVIRNAYTIGVGASRHVGVLAAKSDGILITDAHMRFCPGWDVPTIIGKDRLLCGQTLALHPDDERWDQHHGIYYGAKMVIRDPSAELARYRFLNPVWAPQRCDGVTTLSACMGALYAFWRPAFIQLGGLRMLRGFGGDEELLSIKWMRSGRPIVFWPNLRAGHKFRLGNKAPYQIPLEDLLYNKAMIAHTCTPIGSELCALFGYGVDMRAVQQKVRDNWGIIATEKAYLDSIFTLSWDDYVEKVKQIDA